MVNKNTVIQGDCLEIMKDIPDKSVDMVMCDLPYQMVDCKWDKMIPLEPLWELYKRIIKDNGAIVLTASQPFTSKLVMSNLDMFKYEMIWHKNLGVNHLQCKRMPMKYHENILIFYKKQCTYNPQFEEYSDSTKKRFKEGQIPNRNKSIGKKKSQVYSHFTTEAKPISFKRGRYPSSVQKINCIPLQNKVGNHPTQKPVPLFEYLIKTYTNEGDLVLDNCAGSFTTSIAADNLKREWICIEQEKEYCDKGLKRINENRDRINADLIKNRILDKVTNEKYTS